MASKADPKMDHSASENGFHGRLFAGPLTKGGRSIDFGAPGPISELRWALWGRFWEAPGSFFLFFHGFCVPAYRILLFSWFHRVPGDPKSDPLNVHQAKGESMKNTVFLQHPKIYRFPLICKLDFCAN